MVHNAEHRRYHAWKTADEKRSPRCEKALARRLIRLRNTAPDSRPCFVPQTSLVFGECLSPSSDRPKPIAVRVVHRIFFPHRKKSQSRSQREVFAAARCRRGSQRKSIFRCLHRLQASLRGLTDMLKKFVLHCPLPLANTLPYTHPALPNRSSQTGKA
jgi:hypothetical protein